MRVIIINTWLKGTSTAKIATGLYRKLKENNHECMVLYGAGEKDENPDFVKIANEFDIRIGWLHNQMTGIHVNFAPFVMKRLYKIIEDFKPDIIQLYNLHYYYINIYQLFSYLKKRKLPTVYGMLDEYPYMGYCCYPYECQQYKEGCRHCDARRFRTEYPRNLFHNGAHKTIILKEESYDGFENLVFTGPEYVVKRARESYLLKGKKLRVLDEFVDNEHIFLPKDTNKLREKLGISSEKVVLLSVAPSKDPRKGVADYIKVARRMEEVKKYVFVHVGFQGDTSGLPSNFIPIPFVYDQNQLADYYSLADLFICTSYADTMPNVCLDSLSCGTPFLGYDISGIPYVAPEPYGHYIKQGDLTGMQEYIQKLQKKTADESEECRKYALKRYSPQTYYEETIKIYEDLF